MQPSYDTDAPDSVDPGEEGNYVVDGVATGTDLGVEGAIYEKDTNRYNPAGEPNTYQSNTNFGLPKVYQSTLDSSSDSPIYLCPSDGDYELQSDYTCFKLLNGPTHGAAGQEGVDINGYAKTTSSRKVDDAIADVDTCPDELNSGGASHDANNYRIDNDHEYCTIADFAALASGQSIHGASGNCVRRIYKDLCTERTSMGHHKQAVGNDAGTVQLDDGSTATEASFTKPLKISLSAGKYCDGKNDVEIAGCALQRELEENFEFDLTCEDLARQMVAVDNNGTPDDTSDDNNRAVRGVRKLDISWSITPKSPVLLDDKDPNIKSDFHCTVKKPLDFAPLVSRPTIHVMVLSKANVPTHLMTHPTQPNLHTMNLIPMIRVTFCANQRTTKNGMRSRLRLDTLEPFRAQLLLTLQEMVQHPLRVT